VVPEPAQVATLKIPAPQASLQSVLRDTQLLRLNYGIFALHGTLMALFVVVPFALQAHLPSASHWHVYLPVMAGSIVMMFPAMLLAERKSLQKPVFISAVVVLIGALALLMLAGQDLFPLVIGLLFFFAAFNLLEATLPSMISKLAPAGAKGTAIGVYSSVQFIGTFVGAACGGWLSQHFGAPAVFGFCGTLAVIWLLLAFGMRVPRNFETRWYQLPRADEQMVSGLVHGLSGLPGVREVNLGGDGVAYLKVDSKSFDEQNVIKLLAGET
jgi:MFS family permease